MKIAAAMKLNQTPDMGLVLVDKLTVAIVASCSQDRGALRPYLRKQLVNSGVHAEVKINHKTKQLEGLPMVLAGMQNDQVLLCRDTGNFICPPPRVNMRAAIGRSSITS